MTNNLRKIVAMSFVLIATVCCQSRSKGDPARVYYTRTKEYEAQQAKLKLSGIEAEARLLAVAKPGKPVGAVEVLAIVDEWYLLWLPSKAGLYLTGYYVNGMTGEVEYRHSSHPILKRPQQPKRKLYDNVRTMAGP